MDSSGFLNFCRKQQKNESCSRAIHPIVGFLAYTKSIDDTVYVCLFYFRHNKIKIFRHL